MVVGPGVAIDPRVPQNLTCMLSLHTHSPPGLTPRQQANADGSSRAARCKSATRRALLADQAMREWHSALDHARPGRGRSKETKGRKPPCVWASSTTMCTRLCVGGAPTVLADITPAVQHTPTMQDVTQVCPTTELGPHPRRSASPVRRVAGQAAGKVPT